MATRNGKIEKLCQECGKTTFAWNYQADTKKYCSRECSLKHTAVKGGWNKGSGIQTNTGRTHFKKSLENTLYKTDRSAYMKVHYEWRRLAGKATVCEECGSTRLVQWNNKDKKYNLIKGDWEQLCSRCHHKKEGK